MKWCWNIHQVFLIVDHSKARVVIGITKWTRRMVPTMIWNSHGAIEIWYNWNFLTTFFRETEKFWVNNCPISIKFGAFLVWSVLIVNTKFHQNWTIFGPYFGCEMHINGRDISKFWYFSLLIEIWKCPELEKNRQCRSWGWFYTVSWNAGCGHMCKINPMIDIADFF